MTCPRSLSSVGTHCAGGGSDLTLDLTWSGLERREGLRWFSNHIGDPLVSSSAIQPEVYLLEEEQLSWSSGPPTHGGHLLIPQPHHFSLSSLPCQRLTLLPSACVLGSTTLEYSRGDKWSCLSVLDSLYQIPFIRLCLSPKSFVDLPPHT